MNLLAQLKALAEARTETARLTTEKRRLEEDFRAEHINKFQEVAAAQKNLNILEDKLRVAAVDDWLDVFQKDPNVSKVLMPGITIRESNFADFDIEIATKWAFEHRMALQLDAGTYRKLVLLGQAPGIVTKSYTAAIAQDLDAVLQLARKE